jgi:hypothetical protein
VKAGALNFGRLGKNMQDMEAQGDVEEQRHGQDYQCKQRKPIDLFADCLQIIDELLLLKGIAVRGLADLLQLILNAFQRCVLLQNSVAQIPMLLLQRGHIVLYGLKVHRWMRRGHMLVRSQDIRHGSANVSVQKRQNSLHEWNRRPQYAHGALKIGRPSPCGCCLDQGTLWRRGSPKTPRIARRRRQRGWFLYPNGLRRFNSVRKRFAPVRYSAWFVGSVHTKIPFSVYAFHAPRFYKGFAHCGCTAVRFPSECASAGDGLRRQKGCPQESRDRQTDLDTVHREQLRWLLSRILVRRRSV